MKTLTISPAPRAAATPRGSHFQIPALRNPRRIQPPFPGLVKGPAFTLIEIVLVITIISILGAALIYGIKGNVDVAKETRVESDIKAIATQLKVYEARNLQPPTTEQGLKALVELPTVEPVPERWTQLLEEIPRDPWKHEFRYQYPARRSKADYDVYSLGMDGVESADDIGNWKLARKN